MGDFFFLLCQRKEKKIMLRAHSSDIVLRLFFVCFFGMFVSGFLRIILVGWLVQSFWVFVWFFFDFLGVFFVCLSALGFGFGFFFIWGIEEVTIVV